MCLCLVGKVPYTSMWSWFPVFFSAEENIKGAFLFGMLQKTAALHSGPYIHHLNPSLLIEK